MLQLQTEFLQQEVNVIYIDDLLGIPYKLHGRSLDGFDCYGLVIEVEKRFGHILKDLYTEAYSTCINGLIKTNKPDTSDIIIFFDSKGRCCHIGVYLENDDFIHCDSRGVVIDKLSKRFDKWECYKWQN